MTYLAPNPAPHDTDTSSRPAWVPLQLSALPLPIRDRDLEIWSQLLRDGNLTLEDVITIALGHPITGHSGVEPFIPSPTLQLMAFWMLLACESIAVAPVSTGEFSWNNRYEALARIDMLANLGPELRSALVQLLTAILPEARQHLPSGDKDPDPELRAAIICYERLLVRLLPPEPTPEGTRIFLALLGYGSQPFDQEHEASVTNLFAWMLRASRTPACWLTLAHDSLVQQITAVSGTQHNLRTWYAAQIAAALCARPDDYDPALLASQVHFLKGNLSNFGVTPLGIAVRRLQAAVACEGALEAIQLLVAASAAGADTSVYRRLEVESAADLIDLQLLRGLVADADWPGRPVGGRNARQGH
jgi:hypothetical protein